jgi:hypothetical protein
LPPEKNNPIVAVYVDVISPDEALLSITEMMAEIRRVKPKPKPQKKKPKRTGPKSTIQ